MYLKQLSLGLNNYPSSNVHASDFEVSTMADSVSSSDVAGVSGDFSWDLIDQYQYCSSDSESETALSSVQPLENELALWVNEYQIKHNAVDSLLHILQRHGHSVLPATARILLGSATEVTTEVRSGMDYIYFRVKTELLKHFKNYSLEYRNSIESLEVSLNIDGLPLFTSSKKTV